MVYDVFDLSKTLEIGSIVWIIFGKLINPQQVLQALVIFCKYETESQLELLNWITTVKLDKFNVLIVLIWLTQLSDIKITEPFSQIRPITLFPLIYDHCIFKKTNEGLLGVLVMLHNFLNSLMIIDNLLSANSSKTNVTEWNLFF